MRWITLRTPNTVSRVRTAGVRASAPLILLIVLAACELPFSNPADPDSPEYSGFPTVGNVTELQLIAPVPGETVTAFDGLQVTRVTGAEYRFQIATEESFPETAIILDSGWVPTEYYPFPSEVLVPGSYYWRARARRSEAETDWGDWTDAAEVALVTPPIVSNWLTRTDTSLSDSVFEPFVTVPVLDANGDGFLYSYGPYLPPTGGSVANGRVRAHEVTNWTAATTSTPFTATSAYFNGEKVGVAWVVMDVSGSDDRHLFLFGGRVVYDNDWNWSELDETNRIRLAAAGNTINIQPTGVLPVATAHAAAEVVTIDGVNHVYLTGGQVDEQRVASVYRSAISDSGAVDTWQPLTDRGLVHARDSHGLVSATFNEARFLYAVGGTDRSSVEYTTVNSDGTLEPWGQTSALPGARRDPAVFVRESGGRPFIIVAGGRDADGNSVDTVLAAPVLDGGILGEWTSISTLPERWSGMGMAVTAEQVFLTMGVSFGTPGPPYSNDILQARFDGVPESSIPAPVVTPDTWEEGTSSLRLFVYQPLNRWEPLSSQAADLETYYTLTTDGSEPPIPGSVGGGAPTGTAVPADGIRLDVESAEAWIRVVSERSDGSERSAVVSRRYQRPPTVFAFDDGVVPAGFAFSGDADWELTTSEANSPPYSLRSGSITHNQSSTVTYTGTVPVGSTLSGVSFYHLVSSESFYDRLTFYVNGTEPSGVTRWSGTGNSWQQASFSLNISGGSSFTLRWTYSKDISVSRGEDRAWIDDIELEFE